MTTEQRKKRSSNGSLQGINAINSTSSSSSSNNSRSNNSNNNDTIKVRIKCNIQNCTGKNKDVTLTIPHSFTVYQLKEKVRSSCYNNNNNSNDDTNSNTISRDRYLRLVCSGRLLAPDSSTLDDFNCVKDGTVIHSILAAPGIRGGQQAALSRDSTDSGNQSSSTQRRLRGIGVGSNGLILPNRNSDDDDDDEDDDIEEGRQRRGFDRLRANGISRSEITALRSYFSRDVNRFIEQRNELNQSNNSASNNTSTTSTANTSNSNTSSNTNTNTNNNTDDNDNEDPRIERLRMEEEWMDRQGPYSEFRLNTNITNTNSPLLRSRAFINGIEIDTTTGAMNADLRSRAGGSAIGALGTSRDFVWGFVLGYSFGFMTMFIVWLPTVPHRQRVGILSGFCLHMTLRILERSANESSESV